MADSFIDMDGSTQLYALIGSPVRHSLSPLIHNTSFRLLGINAAYLAFDIHDLKDTINGLKALGVKGFNVTVPYKVAVMPYLDKVSEEARAIGAVNTVVKEGSKWVGYNTDADGFAKTIEKFRNELKNQNVAVFGAGGSARAVIYALLKNHDVHEIVVCNRSRGRADTLIRDFSILHGKTVLRCASSDEIKSLGCKLVVNATPVGLTSNDSMVKSDFFDSGMFAYDLLYDPEESMFLRLARAAGARAINGIDMLMEQAASAFFLWTQKTMPVELIKNLFKKVDNQ